MSRTGHFYPITLQYKTCKRSPLRRVMEPLPGILPDIYSDLGISVPHELFVGLSQGYSHDKDVISLLQRVCDELCPETERQAIVSLEDVVSFARGLGYNTTMDEKNNSTLAVAELIHFLAIELQSRRLRTLPSDPSSVTISHSGNDTLPLQMFMKEGMAPEKSKQDLLEILPCPKDQQFLEYVKEALRINYENRAKIMATRLKVTAQSFLELENVNQPVTDAQDQLNKLIYSIQKDEDSLLPMNCLIDHHTSSLQNSSIERLHSVITEAFRDMGIHINPHVFSCLSHSDNANKDGIHLLQFLCAELSTQTEGTTISSVQDALRFAQYLGYEYGQHSKTDLTIAEFLYFLLIELQSRHLSCHSKVKLKSSNWQKGKSRVQNSIVEEHKRTAEDPKSEELEILQLKDQKFLEFLEEKLRINFLNRAKLIAARLKVTAQSFQETETDPREELNHLISNILKDSDSLLPIRDLKCSGLRKQTYD